MPASGFERVNDVTFWSFLSVDSALFFDTSNQHIDKKELRKAYLAHVLQLGIT